MKRTIEYLWNGNITPAEHCGAHDPEVDELVRLMERNKEDLDKELSKHQKDVLDKYMDCTEEYIYLITMLAFQDGFCLASKLLTEALS